MNRQRLFENLFGKIMGMMLKGQAKRVIKLLQNDPELVAQTKKVDAAVADYKKSLDKALKSNKELMKKRGLS